MENTIHSSTGKTNKLVRSIGLFTAFMLIISSMIGSGVFKKIVPMATELGSPGLVLLAWSLAGIITLFGSLTNAEVAGLIAEPGGQYVYFKKMYGGFFAFLYGWTGFVVISSATIASVSYVFSESVNSLISLPRLNADIEHISIAGIFYPFANFGVKLLTIGLISLLTLINCRGVKYGGMITNIFTSGILICILAIILLGFVISNGNIDNITHTTIQHNQPDPSNVGFFAAMFTAMMSAFWAYEGWNSIGFMGGEIKNPKRNIPLTLTLGVGSVIIIYLLVNFVYLYVMPIDEIINLNKTENSVAAISIVEKFLGSGGGIFISILIIVATLNCSNSSIMTSPRIYYAMAKDQLFFKGISNVHASYQTPANALVLSGVWSCILVLSGSFDQLTDMLIFASFIFYGAGAFGVFILRKKMKDVERPYKVIGYPWIPTVFVLFSISLVIVSILKRPREAAIGSVLIFSGIPFYFYWKKRKKEEEVKEGNIPL